MDLYPPALAPSIAEKRQPEIKTTNLFKGWVPHKTLLKAFCVVALFGVGLDESLSQTKQVASKALTVTDLKKALGEPHKVTQSSQENYTWHYGDSLVFIRGDKVVAWSDKGELSSLAKISELKKDRPPEPALEQPWPNPWTPPSLDQDNKNKIIEIIAE